MNIQPQINVRGVENAAEVEEKIRLDALRLERDSDEIQRYQVWVEAPYGHHRRGRPFVGILTESDFVRQDIQGS